MPLRNNVVEDALERWERKGLVSPDSAALLRDEARAHAQRTGRRTFQYLLAGTGGYILLMAVAVLGRWLWPQMEQSARVIVITLVGAAVHGLGLWMGGRERLRAASYVLQIAGLLVLLGSFAYSESVWPDGGPGGIVIGLLALATPLVTAPRSLLARDPVMPAAHLALSLAFLATFLWRGLGLSADLIVWIIDGVLVVLAALLVVQLRDAQDSDESGWALNAFVTALYAGFVLVALTGAGPLEMEEGVFWALDAWLLGVVALTLWGIHGAPPALQRDWYEKQLAFAVLLSLPLVFGTLDDASTEVRSLVIAAVGALGMRYGIRQGARATLAASCLAVVVAAWHFGLDRGGALGVVLSLAATAALLFWVSTRVGWQGGEGEAAPFDGGRGSP